MSKAEFKTENNLPGLLLRMGLILFLLILFTLFGLLLKSAKAQLPSQSPPDRVINAQFQQEVIDSV